MGCVSSKQFRQQELKERYGALPRSVSMPVYYPPEKEGDSYHFVSLTWSSYGVLKVDNPANNDGSFLGFCKKTSKIGMPDSKLKPIKEEDECKTAGKDEDVVSINTWELMEGLEGGFNPSLLNGNFPPAVESKKLGRSMSFNTVTEVASHYSRIASPKQKIMPLKKTKLSLDGDAEQFFASSMEENMTGSPLFDPAIMAYFGKALDSLPTEDWPITSEYTTSASSSLENASNSSDSSSDAESPQLENAGCEWNTREHIMFNMVSEGKVEKSHVKKRSFSKVSPVDYKDDWKMHASLDSFELKCPSGGEDKVVLYFTSVRGVRKTYEDCCELKLILQGTGVRLDERDVWMHSKFKQELTDLFGKVTGLPRLFIKGRYIGGAEQVKQLHEEGILRKLLEGLPVEVSRQVCDCCGDLRFVVCPTCNGSCKVINEDNVVSRCVKCNENGLIMCPLCS